MRSPSVGATILGAILGLLSGIGFGLYLQQTGTLSATSKVSLVVPAIGLVLGVLAGLFGGRRRSPA